MAEGTIEAGSKRTLPSPKTAILIAGLLVAEAAMIITVMMIVGGEPDVAAASATELDPVLAEQEKIVEVLVLDAKLPNAKSGVAYLYSTEIYAQVKSKHAEQVNAKVQQFYNEIKAEMSTVWRMAEPHHFLEPKLENLTRKVHAMLNERFGVDPETGEPILEKSVIVMGTGFRVDR
jgi:hypothetical protein